jgi:cytochrome c biogenesis protein CcmG/thiol:disulfide interchange protein DsbE
MKRYLLPLAIFLGLVAFLAAGLRLNPREVPSPLIGREAPAFTLQSLNDPGRSLSGSDLRGQVWLLNVWASWCVSCRDEHALLVDLARAGAVPIYGLNYKDSREPALAWLDHMGNPYTASVMDGEGRVGINFGVYGVPETFVIDRQGRIRYKHVGPLTQDVLRSKILPLLKELRS